MKTVYLTDSGTGHSMSYYAKDGILSLPLQITDGNSTWQDYETLSTHDCISLLESRKALMTSQPSAGVIDELMKSLKENGTKLIINVPICSGLSGTGNTIAAMAREYEIPLISIDTSTTAVLQDYLIHFIKQQDEKGADFRDTQARCENAISSCETIVLPKDLMQLARGGRLTPSAAHLAKLLRITPILHLNKETGGRIDVLDKVISRRRAYRRIIDHMKKSGIDASWHVYVAHTSAIADAEDLYHAVHEAFPAADIRIIDLCNVVSAQAGLGCLAVQYFKTA